MARVLSSLVLPGQHLAQLVWKSRHSALRLWAQQRACSLPREALMVSASQILETAAQRLLLEEVCISLMLYQALMRGATVFSCAVD